MGTPGTGATGGAQAPPAQNAPTTAGFKVPRRWDRNVPKFDTDDPEDLVEFIDQVGEILELGKITDVDDKKECLTSYLAPTKRKVWRSLATYNAGSYQAFLDEVYKIYPEIRSEVAGSLDALTKICQKYQKLTVNDEGKLRRFGVAFMEIVKKLMDGKALTTNAEACKRYYDTLESTFANALRLQVGSASMLKTQLSGYALVQPAAAAAKPRRKEDPIDIKDLIDMAEAMAESQD